ncbi:MAG: hypothetical protein VX095_05970 [Pseudomonadota bacterium]|nr:hypothetical protein [Pseudomonadota bacterium]
MKKRLVMSEFPLHPAKTLVLEGFYLCDTRHELEFKLEGFSLRNDCTICKYTRYFFYAAAPVVILIGMGSGPGVAPSLDFITIDLGDYLAVGILAALACLIVARVYVEYFVPWRNNKTSTEVGTHTDDECKKDAAMDRER